MSTEKKTINYNGMELPCIESGYWPDGVTLVCSNDAISIYEIYGAVCLRKGVAFHFETVSSSYAYWALLPPKPAPPRLTNRQLFNLCQNGYAILFNGSVFGYWNYSLDSEKNSCSDGVTGVRAPNSDEWLEPTSDLLEVGE